MLLGTWSWILVILIVGVIFYANKLPELRAEAEKKIQEGKILYEKSRKELEAKANVLKEKQKETQQKIKEKAKAKATAEAALDEEQEITIDDLAFMPKKEDEKKDNDKKE